MTSVKMAMELEIAAPMASITMKKRTIEVIRRSLDLTPSEASLMIVGLYQISSSVSES